VKQNKFKRYMTYDDKRYEICAIRKTEYAANNIADSLRSKGWLSRVENYGHLDTLYAVYKRKKQ